MYLILSIASIVSVFPLYYMFCASTNKSVDVIAGKLIPGTYLIENYKALIANQNLGLALWNSFRNATVLTVLCLLICSIAGYGFEIYHDKGKDVVFTILLTAMMIPFAAIMIPMFRMFSTLKMVTMKSTYAAAIIITFMGAWNNYLWPKVILQNKDAITMPMLVSNLLSGYTVDYGMLMLGVFICTIPTAIIFFAFQKSFTEGITGAVK